LELNRAWRRAAVTLPSQGDAVVTAVEKAAGGGGVVLASGSLPRYGGHVTLGRRP
jgi:hypothetical protein